MLEEWFKSFWGLKSFPESDESWWLSSSFQKCALTKILVSYTRRFNDPLKSIHGVQFTNSHTLEHLEFLLKHRFSRSMWPQEFPSLRNSQGILKLLLWEPNVGNHMLGTIIWGYNPSGPGDVNTFEKYEGIFFLLSHLAFTLFNHICLSLYNLTTRCHDRATVDDTVLPSLTVGHPQSFSLHKVPQKLLFSAFSTSSSLFSSLSFLTFNSHTSFCIYLSCVFTSRLHMFGGEGDVFPSELTRELPTQPIFILTGIGFFF